MVGFHLARGFMGITEWGHAVGGGNRQAAGVLKCSSTCVVISLVVK